MAPSAVRVGLSLGGRGRPAIPWARIRLLLAPSRGAIGGMVGLSLVGAAGGLVPPVGLGFFVTAVVHGRRTAALAWIGVVAAGVLVEAAAYYLSDGLYARTAARAVRDLRRGMFDGVWRRGEDRAPLVSRILSDAETVETLTVGALDQIAMGIFELALALVAIGLLLGPLAGVAAVAAAVVVAASRVLRAPAAQRALERQESLEQVAQAARGPRDGFLAAVDRVARADVRLGWVEAANRHGNLALTGLAPVAVVGAGVLAGGLGAGALLSVYMLASRAFVAVDTLCDVQLDIELARGAIARCFELADGR